MKQPMPKSALELSVVMPCFNESKGIENLVKDWVFFLRESVSSFELILINDGSTDGTGRILDALRRDYKELRVVHQLKTGHGRAVRRGYDLARGNYILQMDSNGCYEPSDFLQLWNEREIGDLILANRTHRLDSSLRRACASFTRKAAEIFFAIQLQDPDVPFRLYQSERAKTLLERLPPLWDSVNLSLAILIKKETPNRLVEVKIPYRVRPFGSSHLSLTSRFKLEYAHFKELLKLRIDIQNPSLSN